jgi:hypothetical protein
VLLEVTNFCHRTKAVDREGNNGSASLSLMAETVLT